MVLLISKHKKKVLQTLLYSVLVVSVWSCSSKRATQPSENSGFTSLFNGKDINNWIVKINHHEVGENFGRTFRVADSMIQVRYDQYGAFNEQYGHLYFEKPFSSFHLKLDYRFVGKWKEDAPSYTLLNSGVMYHSQDPRTMNKDQDWPISVEMQFLAGLGDGEPRPTGNMCSPGTEIVYEGVLYPNHCLNSSSKTYDGDQWVHAELIVFGDSVKHLINGDTVLRYSFPQIGGGVVNNYKPEMKEDGKILRSGFIALQSEGQPIDFKNIFIKELEP